MRKLIARRFIIWTSGWINTSCYAWMRYDRDEWPRWVHLVIPVPSWPIAVATLVDKEAAVDQMTEEGWWG